MSASAAKRVIFVKSLRRDQTPEEQVLWNMLRGRKFRRLKFKRQVPIGRFVVDFLCPWHRLIIEVDGPIHEKRRDYDAERDVWLRGKGYKVLRFENREVRRNLMDVLHRIAAEIRSAS